MIKNLINLIKIFIVYWKEFSLSIAYARVLRDIPYIDWNKRRNIYEKKIVKYLSNYYSQNLDINEEYIPDNTKQNINCKTIWVMWWQGENAMPPIVHACFVQLKKVSKQHKLILITKENWNYYIQLPEYIIMKVNKGMITLTHFSDIVRVNLLNNYGGLWLDATMWVENIPEECFSKTLYTLHGPDMFPEFISRGKWMPFIWGSNIKKYKLFSDLKSMFSYYWKKHNIIIDYLLIDYCIFIICEKNSNIKREIESLSINNNFYYLNKKINESYNIDEYNEIINRSSLQKLTYKKTFQKYDNNGNLTNYGYILLKAEIL